MSENPYVAPDARVADAELRVPGEITGKIRGAVIAGLVAAGFQAVLVALALSGSQSLGVDAWGVIDLAILLGLAYGVYRKSRICAVLLLLFFLLGRIMFMIESGKPNGLLVTAIFLYYYGRGVMGTFEYHKFVSDPKRLAAQDAELQARVSAIEALRNPGAAPDPAAPASNS